jgi:hypothetical protein
MVIWAMTWATRCEIGACELTHGQAAGAAVCAPFCPARAGLWVAAPAGTEMSAAPAAAASTTVTRPAREVARCRARKGR